VLNTPIFSGWWRFYYPGAYRLLWVRAGRATPVPLGGALPLGGPSGWLASGYLGVVPPATALLWRPLRQQRHQVGGTERRPWRRGCNSHDDRQLPDALTARASDSLT
jgi:hypothetical protein